MLNLDILISMILNYPILSFWGFSLPLIVTLVSPNGQETTVMEKLRTIGKPIIVDEYMSLSSIGEKLTHYRSQAIFYIYRRKSKKADSIINIFHTAVSSGQINGKPLSAIPIVITSQLITDEDRIHFMIPLGDEIGGISISYKDYLLNESEVQSVRSIFHEVYEQQGDVLDMLHLSNMFLYLLDKDSDHRANGDKIIGEMISFDEDYHANSGLEDIFSITMQNWLEEKEDINICRLPNVSNKDYELRENTLFYNDNFIYMTEGLFENMVEPLLGEVPLNRLKAGLKEGMFLIPESKSSSYTVKMNIYHENGKFERIRMLRFDRTKLVFEDGTDVVDFCKCFI